MVYSIPHACKITSFPPTDQQPNLTELAGWLAEGRPVSRADDPNPRRPGPRSRPSPNWAALRTGRLPEVYFGLGTAAAAPRGLPL